MQIPVKFNVLKKYLIKLQLSLSIRTANATQKYLGSLTSKKYNKSFGWFKFAVSSPFYIIARHVYKVSTTTYPSEIGAAKRYYVFSVSITKQCTALVRNPI